MVNNPLNILLLSPYLPAIDTSACSRKVYDHIQLLHQRGHRIYLISFCSEHDKKRINAIGPCCAQLHLVYIRDYSRYPYKSSSFKKKIESICKNQDIDILQCEKAYMSRYMPKDINVASILIEHEVLSVSLSERARLENNFIKRFILFARKIKKHLEEKRWYRKFNRIIVFSENDKEFIRKLYNIDHAEVIPLGINLKNYPLQDAKEKPYDLIFVGNFSHHPNTDAISYFCKEILPLIKNKLPKISLTIIGSNAPASIYKLGKFNKNILVTGYVDNVLEGYSKSKVFIAPIRYGTGMRFKILEALASRVPVVTTSIGARGIIFKENIKIADTEKEFADTVIDLLDNPDRCSILAEDGRKVIEKYYNCDTLLDRYEDIYNGLLKINTEKIT